jgi:TrmH family RNA methyltransferase
MAIGDQIRIVLVGTTHPGNIGAVARAMKTMALSRLVLVTPRIFPSAEATARAAGADDILARALICDSLPAALAGCERSYATTARRRHLEWPVISPREFAADLAADAVAGGDIAVVFGREHSGLSNAELDLCGTAIRIPTQAQFSSLNIAMAVQIIAYELFVARGGAPIGTGAAIADADPPAPAAEIDHLYQHLLAVMERSGYFDPADPRLLPRRIRRLLNKGELRRSEVQILRGFLTAVQSRLSAKGHDS